MGRHTRSWGGNRPAAVRLVTAAILLSLTLASCFDLNELFVFIQNPERITEYDFTRGGLSSIPEGEWEHLELDLEGRVTDGGSGVPVSGIRILASETDAPVGARNTVLYFSGNRSNLYNAIHAGMRFRKLGYDFFGIEYRGYGRSAESFEITERSVYEDARAAYRYLTRTLGLAQDRIIVVGFSLGSAAAVELASTHRPGGLVLMAPMFDADSIGANISGGYAIDAGWFIDAAFENHEKIGRVESPIMFLHGMKDRLIPYTHSVELRKLATAAPVTRIELQPDAAHEDLPGWAGWYEPIVTRFIERDCR